MKIKLSIVVTLFGYCVSSLFAFFVVFKDISILSCYNHSIIFFYLCQYLKGSWSFLDSHYFPLAITFFFYFFHFSLHTHYFFHCLSFVSSFSNSSDILWMCLIVCFILISNHSLSCFVHLLSITCFCIKLLSILSNSLWIYIICCCNLRSKLSSGYFVD